MLITKFQTLCSTPQCFRHNKQRLRCIFFYVVSQGLVSKIEDLVIKTLICGEIPIATAYKMFVPHHGSCFGKLNTIVSPKNFKKQSN